MRVFHLFKSIFDVGLGSAAQNDLFGCPVVVVGTQDAFAETEALEVLKGRRVDPEGEVHLSLRPMDLSFKDLGGVLARPNGIELF